MAVGIAISVVLAYGLIPAARPTLRREAGVVEWTTAVLFLVAGAIGVQRLSRTRAPWRNPQWLIPVLALMAMLEELGPKLFEVVGATRATRPLVYGERLDGLHDLLQIAVTMMWERRDGVAAWALGAGVLLLLAGGGLWAMKHRQWLCRPTPSWLFFEISIAFGAVAQVFDLTSVAKGAKTIEETLELIGALAMLFATAHVAQEAANR